MVPPLLEVWSALTHHYLNYILFTANIPANICREFHQAIFSFIEWFFCVCQSFSVVNA